MATPSHVNIHSITYGTGHDIFTTTILPAIRTARHQVLLITCFWADSPTRTALHETLLHLNTTALSLPGPQKITVRIGFSSSSLLQKLLHTRSPDGQIHPPSTWSSSHLGLPHPDDIPGLDLQVKSIFFLPFSVWHPKFVVVDQTHLFLPSCNVSWEEWFEGCVHLSGPIVRDFTTFWRQHWAADESYPVPSPPSTPPPLPPPQLTNIPGHFLPSPHHQNPHFRPLPCHPAPQPPPTPLNTTLLALFAHAHHSITLQTPNLTSPPVLAALRAALERGVDVRITTSEGMMVLEQIFTAGRTTGGCVRTFIKRYRRLKARRMRGDEEGGRAKVGELRIVYFHPRDDDDHVVHSHVKLTVVDDETVVWGSGNMDRASWYTSQELGVAFTSREMVRWSLRGLEREMVGRGRVVFDSRIDSS